MADLALSIPFNHPLLSVMNRSQVAFLSAVVYASRLHNEGQWFALSDAKISEWIGLSRTTIHRLRKWAVEQGYVLVSKMFRANYYQIGKKLIELLTGLSNQLKQKREDEKAERIERIANQVNTDDDTKTGLSQFMRMTGRVPNALVAKRWAETIRDAIRIVGDVDSFMTNICPSDRSPGATIKRIRQNLRNKSRLPVKPQEPQKPVQYEVFRDPELGWIARVIKDE